MAKIATESLERLAKIKKQLEDNRKRYDDVWKEAARYINPNMADWEDDPQGNRRPDDTVHIYDNTVIKASQTLTDGLQGYSFARNQAWFKSALEDHYELDRDESAWLQEAERRMYSQLQRSNFYDEGRVFVKCCADFGTAVMLRIDDVARGMPVYKTQHLKWCVVDENEFGEVDVLFRDFWINAYQAASRFGPENLPQNIRDAHENQNMRLFRFTQVILPPDRYDLDIGRKNGMSCYSVFWADCERDRAIEDGWYPLKPFFCWRWSRNLDGDVWGVDSPGMVQLPNVKQLNLMRRDRTVISQTQANPPLKASEGLEGKINLRPRGINYLRPGQDFTPALTHGALEPFDSDIALLQRTVNEAYFTDLFLILSQNIERKKTATEVAGIQGEKAALMSAFYGRLTAEFLEPVLEDLFALELTAGRIRPPPESLGSRLRFDMVSPLAQMQERYLTMGASQQAIAEIAALAQFEPAVLDNVDLDQYVRNIADAYGMDKKIVVDMAAVQRIRQARAQQQAQIQQFAMQIEQAKAGADILGKLPEGAVQTMQGAQ
jgi:hypothetical protein